MANSNQNHKPSLDCLKIYNNRLKRLKKMVLMEKDISDHIRKINAAYHNFNYYDDKSEDISVTNEINLSQELIADLLA